MRDDKFLLKLGSRIKSIRKAQNVAQVTLASRCGIEKASMSRMEAGKSNPTILTLKKVSGALGVPMSELFKD